MAKAKSRVGYVLADRYELLSVIGRGGMSIVYLAQDNTLNKIWAVKEYLQTGARRDDRIRRENLKREAELMKDLNHPAFPRIVDIIEAEDMLFIVMDYIDGKDLGEMVRKEKRLLTEEEAIDLGLQLCDILGYLHSPKEDTRSGKAKPIIVYRDLKPDNIKIDDNGTVRLLDFGIARKYEEGKSHDTVIQGSQGYMAPEQERSGMQTDPRADIYSFGVTLHYLLTGQSPDKSLSIRPIREYNPQLSAGLEKVIAKCVQTDREQRYQSCRELAYDLEHSYLLTDEHVNRQKRKIKIFGGLAIASAVCLAVGVFGFVMSSVEKNGTYEAKIEEASHISLGEESTVESPDYVQKESALKAAVEVDDTRAEAYRALLDDVYMADGVLDSAESESFYSLMNNHAIHCADQQEYARLCFDYADKLFFYKNDYAQARAWFQRAIDTSALSPDDQETAVTYCSICEFSENLSRAEGSDALSSERNYADYWNNLCERLDALEAENASTFSRLKMYELVVDACAGPSFVQEFKNAGITQGELESRVEDVEKKAHDLEGAKLNLTQEQLRLEIVERCAGGVESGQNPAAGSALEVIQRIYASVIDTATSASNTSGSSGASLEAGE